MNIEVGPNGMCVYCGEFRGTEIISDPNGSLSMWKVCVTCKKIIKEQQLLSLGIILKSMAKDEEEKKIAESMIKEAQEKIDLLSAESFLPTYTVIIKKKELKK